MIGQSKNSDDESHEKVATRLLKFLCKKYNNALIGIMKKEGLAVNGVMSEIQTMAM